MTHSQQREADDKQLADFNHSAKTLKRKGNDREATKRKDKPSAIKGTITVSF